MTAWLGWRARIEHLLNPGNECLCEVCCRIHSDLLVIIYARLAQELRDARTRNAAEHPSELPPVPTVTLAPPFFPTQRQR
jgi:hypothetical protein